MGQVRRLLALLVVVMVAGAGGCGRTSSTDDSQRFTQGGGSMEPTVKAGQVIAARSVGSEYVPQRGDIVLFHAGSQWGDSTAPFLKRVIAVGGETIACCDTSGRVTVDGAPLAEPYVATDSSLGQPPNARLCLSRRFGPVTVAKDAIFVMGDNRMASNDSRCLGPIPVTSVFAVMIS
jgi:signal peptidase I